ncbi:STAS domain-containing protein [Actinomadura rudentiformis]|uniref:Anti-sigma factor antagonist n=2 Tax=Actinomadura rudentiformis TaxID=359158 RepID=A0A6H9Z4B1_9ACTN|nr:STAS domain-containing protein [Actinomadura rudentiformis]
MDLWRCGTMSQMQVLERVEGTVTVVTLAGDLALGSAEEVRDRLAGLVRGAVGEGRRDLLLDLAGVDFMDSMGLRVLIHVFRRVQEAGGRMALSAVQPRAGRALDVTGLNASLDIYSTTEEALTALRRPAGR